MKNILSYFEYKGITYFIALMNNKISYLKYVDEVIRNDLTFDESNMMRDVLRSLVINKDDSSFVREIDVFNHSYNLFRDRRNNHYFWIPIDGEYNDNKFLNFKYNHQHHLLFALDDESIESKGENKKSEFYNSFVKIGHKLIPVFVVASLSLAMLNSCNVVEMRDGFYTEKIVSDYIEYEESKTEEIREYNFDEVREAINGNPNLTDEEKDFICRLKFVFDENHQYMDLDLVINRLSSLKISFNQEVMEGAVAVYDRESNEIKISYGSFEENRVTFIHEILHVLQAGKIPFISELSNEMFTNEVIMRLYHDELVDKEFFLDPVYADAYRNGTLVLNSDTDWDKYICLSETFTADYGDYEGMYFALAEILPEDVLRNFQFDTDNTNLVVDALVNIDNPEDDGVSLFESRAKAESLIERINSIRTYSYEKEAYEYAYDMTDCCLDIDYYFQKAKGYSMFEDPNICMRLISGNKVRLNSEYNAQAQRIRRYLFDEYEAASISRTLNKTYLSDVRENTVVYYQGINVSDEGLDVFDGKAVFDDVFENEYRNYLSNNFNKPKGSK